MFTCDRAPSKSISVTLLRHFLARLSSRNVVTSQTVVAKASRERDRCSKAHPKESATKTRANPFLGGATGRLRLFQGLEMRFTIQAFKHLKNKQSNGHAFKFELLNIYVFERYTCPLVERHCVGLRVNPLPTLLVDAIEVMAAF